ncbi:MAG TPA: NRDE family protein [Terriglobia bacterium]|nr:NRDE family protein [Terriglobia bacterium]
MCTVSWIHTSSGYQLLFNRDERNTRKPALAPAIHETAGVRFIAPVDGDHSGSWIAVNELGITFSLVNRYRCLHCSGERHPQPPSRGLLLIGLADCHSLEEAQSRFDSLDLAAYQPFTVVVLAPGRPSLLLHWTGRDSLIECNGEAEMPLTSSSFDSRGVEVYRKRLFNELAKERGRVDLPLLMDFHASHVPTPSAYSPCMHRENAQTVSFSRVTVGDGVIEFVHFPVPPCARRAREVTADTLSKWKLVQMRIALPQRRRAAESFSQEHAPVRHSEGLVSRV